MTDAATKIEGSHTVQCHMLPLRYIALSDFSPHKKLSLPVGSYLPPLEKLILRLTRSTTPDDIISIHTLNFYRY